MRTQVPVRDVIEVSVILTAKDTVYKKIGRLPMHHNKIVTPVTVANA